MCARWTTGFWGFMSDPDLAFKLADGWQKRGVERGATLLLHSSAKRTLKFFDIHPAELIRSFLHALGPEGTLLLPVFNFGWCRGEPFDIRSTPGETGVLGNTAMQWPGAARTPHPVYGAMVLGRHAQTWRDRTAPSTADTGEGYGRSSIFGWLHHVGGTIGVLDLDDQSSQTSYHYIEQCAGAHWRHHKFWRGQYTDENGETTLREYSIYVRNEGIQTNVNPMGELLWRAGLYQGDRPHVGSGLRTIKAAAMYDAVTPIVSAIRQGAADHRLLFLRNEVA